MTFITKKELEGMGVSGLRHIEISSLSISLPHFRRGGEGQKAGERVWRKGEGRSGLPKTTPKTNKGKKYFIT